MKLTYNGKILKESENMDEIEEYRRLYKKEETTKYSKLIDRYLKLEEDRKYVLPRNPKDSDEEYENKVNMVNKEFVEELTSIINELPLTLVKIKYIDVPNGNIRIITDTDNISFGALNGTIRNMIPTMGQLKITK